RGTAPGGAGLAPGGAPPVPAAAFAAAPRATAAAGPGAAGPRPPPRTRDALRGPRRPRAAGPGRAARSPQHPCPPRTPGPRRAANPPALLAGVARKRAAARARWAEFARQMRNLRDAALGRRIAETWGVVRATPADRARAIAAWRKKLTAPAEGPPDVALGRAV